MDRERIFQCTRKISLEVGDIQGSIVHRADWPNIHEVIAAERQAALIQDEAEKVREECLKHIKKLAKGVS